MKRQKERLRQERQKEKQARRQERRLQKGERPKQGDDPDIAGIVPGPQPPLEDFTE